MSAIFPTAIAGTLDLLTAINNTKVTLNVNAGIGDTTLTVDDASPLPSSGYLTFDDNESNPESVFYTGKSGNNLTGVTRAADSTAAGTHSTGSHLEQRWNAAYHNVLVTEMIAVEQNLSDRFGLDSGTHFVKIVDGAVGTPSLTFASDTNTGLYRIGADDVAIATGGVKALEVNATQQVVIPKTSSQIVLGVTNTSTISVTAPSGSRVLTIPDPGADASFVMTAGTQTIAGAKTFSGATTFSATLTMSGATIAMGSNKIAGLPDGTASGDAIHFGQLQNIANANVLINSGMEIWQRGTSFSTPATNTYTADRWRVVYSGAPTFTVAQETSTIDSGTASLKVNISVVNTATSFYVSQLVENFAEYKGKTVTVQVRINTSLTGLVARLSDGVTTIGASSATSGSGWQTLTATGTLSTSASQLEVQIGYPVTTPATGNWFIDSCMLVLGSVPISYLPRPFAQELTLCQRYFCKSFDLATAPAQASGTNNGAVGYQVQVAGTSGGYLAYVPFPVSMRTVPTVTFYNATSANNKWYDTGAPGDSGTPALQLGGQRSMSIRNSPQVSGDSAGNIILIHYAADAEM